MPNYKVSGTVTPSAKVIAYPHSSDIIYGTADATGAYEVQWTAATAEQTRVVAVSGSRLKIEIVTPVSAIDQNSLYYYSVATGLDERVPLTAQGGAAVEADGLSFPTLGSSFLSPDETPSLFLQGDLTILSRMKLDQFTGIYIFLTFGDLNAPPASPNCPYQARFAFDGLFHASQSGAGAIEFAGFNFPVTQGQYYDLAITRKDNQNGTSTVKVYADGVLLDTDTINTPDGGDPSVQRFEIGETGGGGFVGKIQALAVYDSEFTLQQIDDFFNGIA